MRSLGAFGDESPAEHIRNALQMLEPMLYAGDPVRLWAEDLRAIKRRLELALAELEAARRPELPDTDGLELEELRRRAHAALERTNAAPLLDARRSSKNPIVRAGCTVASALLTLLAGAIAGRLQGWL